MRIALLSLSDANEALGLGDAPDSANAPSLGQAYGPDKDARPIAMQPGSPPDLEQLQQLRESELVRLAKQDGAQQTVPLKGFPGTFRLRQTVGNCP